MDLIDLIESGCTIQGAVEVSRFDEEGNKIVLFSGDGEDIPASDYDEWGGAEISYLFYDGMRELLCIEL